MSKATSKRILSLALSVAMLLTCISGLTLITSAASTVRQGDLTPNAYDGGQGAYYSGTYDGFDVFGWQSTGWFSWNGGRIANALGLETSTVADLSITFDYYWERAIDEDGSTNSSNNNWWQFKTVNEDGTGTEGDGFGTLGGDVYNMVGNQWAEVTVSRTAQLLKGDGKDDMFINVGDLNNGKLYIRGVKAVAVVGEDTYTALWGSYTRAAIDFTSGEAATVNASVLSGVDGNVMQIEELGVSGRKMTEHNQNFRFHVDSFGVTDAVAVTVEYYLTSTDPDDNTRINFGFNGKNFTLRRGATASNVNSENLATDQLAACTFVISGEDAQTLSGGTDVQITSWTVGEGHEGRYLYVKSISIMPASMLDAVEDPGYDFYDFVETVAENPYYPDYTKSQSYDVSAVWGDNGGQLYFKTNGLDSASNVMIKFFKAEGAEAADVSIDYQNTTEGGWKGSNGHVAAFDENGVATYELTDAIFQNGLNGLGSFRMNADNAAKIARVEIYTASDKTALNEAIAQEVNTEGKTSVSVAAYEAALAAAQDVAAETFATAVDVQTAIDTLNEAIAALKDIPVLGNTETTVLLHTDAALLYDCRDEGPNVGFTNTGSYVEFEVNVAADCWFTFSTTAANGNGVAHTQALQDAQGATLGQAEIPGGDWSTYTEYQLGDAYLKAGVQTLRLVFTDGGSNFKSLTFVPDANRPAPANKEALQAAVDTVIDLSVYTEESVAAYNAALGAAQEVLANENATQDEADAALNALNAAKAALVDTRYTTAGGAVFVPSANSGSIELMEIDGTYCYVWKYPSADGRFIGIADPEGVLNDSTSVTYEYDVMFDTTNMNDRCFLCYGTTEGWKGVNDNKSSPDFTGYAAHGNWLPTPAVGTWGTIQMVNDKYDPTSLNDTRITALGNWVSTGTLYVRAIRAYDTSDPTKVVSVTFNEAPMDAATDEEKAALQAEIDNPVDTTGKTSASIAAYQETLNKAAALLAEETVLKVKVDAAMAEINAAKAALKDMIRVGSEPITISATEASVTGAGSYSTGDDCIGNTGNGTVITFEMYVEEAGTYDLSIMAYTGAGTSTVSLGDGTTADCYGTFDVVGSAWGADQWPEEGFAFTVDLAEGANSIVLTLSNSINLRSITLSQQPSILVDYSEGALVDHDGVASLEFVDRWAFFDLGVDEGIYDMDVTFYYASTGTPWWQIQLSGEDGTRYSEDGKYSAGDGFQQQGDWLTNSNGEWTSGTVSFTGAKLGADDDWKSGVSGTSFDFGFHICGDGENPNLYIRGVEFAVTDSEGNVTTKMWGTKPVEAQPEEPTCEYIDFLTGESYGLTCKPNGGEGKGEITENGLEMEEGFAYFLVTDALTDDPNTVKPVKIVLTFGDGATGTVGVEYQKADNAEGGNEWGHMTGDNALVIVDGKAEVTLTDAAFQNELNDGSSFRVTDLAGKVLEKIEVYVVTDAPVEPPVEPEGDWDLVVEDIYVVEVDKDGNVIEGTETKTIKAGTTVKLVALIKNIGDKDIPADLGRFGVAFSVDGGVIAWSDNYKANPVELKAGETLELVSCGGGAMSDGTWAPEETAAVTAFVNDNESDGVKDEADRTNNTMEVTITVTDLDVAPLQAAVNTAKAIDLSGYTDETAAAVTAALEKANAAMTALASQEALDAAKTELEAAVAALVKKPEENPDEPTGLWGDVNEDGKVDTTDARLTLQFAAKRIKEEDIKRFDLADVNADGKVDTTDARLILQHAAKRIKTFPVEDKAAEA